MKFEITSIADAGDLQKERVVIKAKEGDDIGSYALFRTTKADETSVHAGSLPNVYWFDDRKMKTGDYAVLYTKAGTASEKTSDGGSTSYFFYWDLDQPIWDDPDNQPVLAHIDTWQVFRSKKKK